VNNMGIEHSEIPCVHLFELLGVKNHPACCDERAITAFEQRLCLSSYADKLSSTTAA
jgi:hypothetical protein